MDSLFIRQLKIAASVGILARERKKPQDILLDLTIVIDAQRIARGDDIACTIDYAKVRDCITQFAASRHFNLIETLADGIAKVLIKDFTIEKLSLTLIKPGAFADDAHAGVTLERQATAN